MHIYMYLPLLYKPLSMLPTNVLDCTCLQLYFLTATYLVAGGAAVMTEFILIKLTSSFLSQTYPLWSYVQLEISGCLISVISLVRD